MTDGPAASGAPDHSSAAAPGGDSAVGTSAVGVAVLARRARLGHGKTRLARAYGPERTLAIYRRLIARCAEVVAASGLPACVYFDPEPGDGEIWTPTRFAYATQVDDPDLGPRLAAAAADAADRFGAVLLIGTDCPYLTPDSLREAAAALRTHDAVIGPSLDGGYYLLGLRRATPAVFVGIPWSTSSVARETRRVLAKAGLTCAELPPLADIDEPGDWEAYAEAHGREALPRP